MDADGGTMTMNRKQCDPEDLLKAAAAAAKKAYSPYSKYRVGAALLTSAGEIFTGCNVENASYGLTVCAERAAFCVAVSSGTHIFKAMAIVAGGSARPYPCGACRQVMAEFCNPDFKIYCATAHKLRNFEEFRLGTLLPKSFATRTR
jgi:cytidine deaminase